MALAAGTANKERKWIIDTNDKLLNDNTDTEYNPKLFETLQGAFNHAGTLKVREGFALKGVFRLVFNKNQFPEISAQLKDEV